MGTSYLMGNGVFQEICPGSCRYVIPLLAFAPNQYFPACHKLLTQSEPHGIIWVSVKALGWA